MDGGGFHLYGASSTGKSTALYAAGSVWGGGSRNGFVESWKATSNGMEAQAALHNDSLLLLDEMSEVPAKDISEIVYALSNGHGKARMTKTGSSRKAVEFRVLFLSSGEKQQADLLSEMGKTMKGGQAARLVQIQADNERFGMFDDLHDYESPEAFSDGIRENARAYYGTPIRAFLGHLASHKTEVQDQGAAAKEAFMREMVPDQKSAGEVYRAAARFAMVGFAGELATRQGLTGWRSGEALEASKALFRAGYLGAGEWVSTRQTRASNVSARSFSNTPRDSRARTPRRMSGTEPVGWWTKKRVDATASFPSRLMT